MNHPVELLQTFVVAAEELHFATAAERLHLDPSSVSRRVKQLEQRAGLTLFDRSTRNVELTPAGAALLTVARPALDRLGDVDRMIESLRRVERSTVSVGLIAHAADVRLLERLTAGASGFGIELATSEWGFDDPSAGVRDARSDLGIIFEPITPDRLIIQPLFRVPRIAFVPTGHRLADRQEVAMAELLDEPWVKPSSSDQVFVDYWMAMEHRGGREPLVATVGTTAEAGLLAIMSGRCISIGATARTDFRSDGVVGIPITDVEPASVAVVTRALDGPSPARLLADQLAKAYQATTPDLH